VAEPLIEMVAEPLKRDWMPDPQRPLAGVRVLDLTRVLAGPVATRLLAGLGAQVLRIDPPWRDEPGVEIETALGKSCARLDLRDPAARAHLLDLLAGADVLVHGYRPGALEGLGLGADQRHRANPGLVEASLCAYGWTGPWHERRGFDSLVQMSSGIAAPANGGADPNAQPTPLPVQALDHAAGYLLAMCVGRGLRLRRIEGRGSSWRTSLARVAALLSAAGSPPPAELGQVSWSGASEEATAWGPVLRLPGPVRIGPAHLHWDIAAAPLGSAEAEWTLAAPR
jgi:crotonobetainyl-CoA:carnitine CoA-transferase CaiB-like acyl-CoA transferase